MTRQELEQFLQTHGYKIINDQRASVRWLTRIVRWFLIRPPKAEYTDDEKHLAETSPYTIEAVHELYVTMNHDPKETRKMLDLCAAIAESPFHLAKETLSSSGSEPAEEE
jgi:hypothetical protein